ncbi:mutS protein homolog 5-like [Oppia nitens]|uniref:mutS protein homolog 5-like n=1 Tax=Oppia nitens TaxID=1686743 RepID=UPI0023DAD2C0|nr:mutS protein homolog 5-like [Oppia nitens]
MYSSVGSRSDQNIGYNDLSEDGSVSDDTLLETIDDSLDISYLCISYSDNKCGSTLYYSNTHSIQVIQEVEDNDFDSVFLLLIQTQPKHVIISSRTDPKLIELLKTYSNNKTNNESQITDQPIGSTTGSTNIFTNESSIDVNSNIDNNLQTSQSFADLLLQMDLKFVLHIVSNNLFNFENSKTRILSIDFDNHFNVEFSDEKQKILYISSIFDFSDNNTFRSFGALLRFLDQNCTEIHMQTEGSMVEISSISRLYLQQLVAINRNAYESLQIFRQEWHPSAAKQGFNAKEGLSLYGLFNCCVSKVGAAYLRKIFLLPTQDVDIILDRLNAIEFFATPNNMGLKNNVLHYLKHIKSVTTPFNRLMTNRFSVMDLKTLFNNLINAINIRAIVSRQQTSLQIFDQIMSIDKDMDEMAIVINKIVDLDKTFKLQTFEINYGIDHELDNARNHYIHIPKILQTVALSEAQTYGPLLKQCDCVYIPQIGFLTSSLCDLSVPTPTTSYNDLNESGLHYLLKAGNRVYYKTMRTKQLDEEFGDIQPEILDRQIQIMFKLQEMMATKRHLFQSIVKFCAKLDALIAMSQTAVNYGYIKPNIISGETIEIIDGKHPLNELVSQSFVSNDYKSGEQYTKIKLISGPNGCGKSIYLKQICLIVFMAHIGSYVPAVKANIPIVDRIFTRLQTPESITSRLSTFVLDLNQLANATKNATKRSLVVIDEFGKGTQSVDGLALMAASIDYWLNNIKPHLLVSSHFQYLPSFLSKTHLYSCQTFEFIKDEHQLVYLFKLIDGHINQSITSHIAYLSSIPVPVIERGLNICQSISTKEIIKPLNIEEMQNKFKDCIRIATEFLESDTNCDESIHQFFQSNFVSTDNSNDQTSH